MSLAESRRWQIPEAGMAGAEVCGASSPPGTPALCPSVNCGAASGRRLGPGPWQYHPRSVSLLRPGIRLYLPKVTLSSAQPWGWAFFTFRGPYWGWQARVPAVQLLAMRTEGLLGDPGARPDLIGMSSNLSSASYQLVSLSLLGTGIPSPA